MEWLKKVRQMKILTQKIRGVKEEGNGLKSTVCFLLEILNNFWCHSLIINAFIPTHMFPLRVIPINLVGPNTNTITKQYQWWPLFSNHCFLRLIHFLFSFIITITNSTLFNLHIMSTQVGFYICISQVYIVDFEKL